MAQSQVEELLVTGYEDPRLLDPDGGQDVEADGSLAPEPFRDPDHADPKNPLDGRG